MNKLTAMRTFGKPGFTPVRSFRIYANKWYLCTFQNVERDPRCDYVGLGEGEYTEVLPGKLARRARDASLNHLNGITLWQGEVWSVTHTQHNNTSYHTSQATATIKALEINAKNTADWADCQRDIDNQLAQTDDEIKRKYSKCSDWYGVAVWREGLKESRQQSAAYFRTQSIVERIR